MIESLKWVDGKILLLDQRLLPHEEKYLECVSYKEVIQAIKLMVVRGAPAIGVVAAFGIAMAARDVRTKSLDEFKSRMDKVFEEFSKARPTAVNLFWAIERMRDILKKNSLLCVGDIIDMFVKEAEKIREEDILSNIAIGEHGNALIKGRVNILTHCNAGALATAGFGTALGVIRTAYNHGKVLNVFVDETRPFLQGSRLTAWELSKDGIPVTLITDNMAGSFMQKGLVDVVIVGADRIAVNGDTANKIGTYPLSVLAKVHNIPFFVAAPFSTIDLATQTGEDIPIEERPKEEVTCFMGQKIAPEGINVRNPAFDVTPASNITAIITERGVFSPPFRFVSV